MFAAKPIRALGLLVLLFLTLTLLGEFLHRPILVFIFKPLATILILALPVAQWLRNRSTYALFISIGIFFSLLGDVALIFPDSCFLYGLIFFLLAHIAYIIAFSFHLKFPAHPVLWVPYFAFAILLYLFLFPNLPADLRIPVALYAFLLSAMAAQAMGRLLILKNAQARSAAIGGLLFLLSDSLLALDRFRSTIPAAYLFILTSYYLAQWLIAASTLPNHTRPATPLSS